MNKKLKIAILFGGRSGEHEVSLMSAKSVLGALDREKYDVVQIGITHDGAWLSGENALAVLLGESDDELETIFGKFVQSTKTKNGAGGTGLGLAICRQIMNIHKGFIWAENNTDKGATFIFELPLSVSTELPQQQLVNAN